LSDAFEPLIEKPGICSFNGSQTEYLELACQDIQRMIAQVVASDGEVMVQIDTEAPYTVIPSPAA